MNYPNQSLSNDPPSNNDDDLDTLNNNRYGPLWLLLFAALLLTAAGYLLLSRPVGKWVASFQPTSTLTPTNIPTITLTPVPTATQLPTRTPTLVPTIERSSARAVPLFFLPTDLRSIYMVNQQVGWGRGQFSLWRTEDGWQTWVDVTPEVIIPRLPGLVPFFLDEERAWIFDSNGSVDFSGKFYFTSDAGKTWESRLVMFGGQAPSLFFLDDESGWVLTDSYNFTRELYRTENGGIDWAPVHRVAQQQEGRSGFLPDIGFLRGPVFNDILRGWIGGTTPIFNGRSSVYESKDGGRLWLQKWLEMDPGIASMWISAPRFFEPDGNLAVMVAYAAPIDEIINAQGIFNENQFGVTPVDLEGARYVFFTSSDQGDSWRQTASVNISNPSPFSLPTSNHFYILDQNQMISSADAGRTWLRMDTNLESLTSGILITAMQFVDSNTGWCWGVRDDTFHLYYTRDGGSSWNEVGFLR